MKRLKRFRLGWLIWAVLPLALGCSSVPGILGPINDALGILCETRAALTTAHRELEEGDVGAAIDILKAYLVEHGHDDEVAAVLQLLEAQVRKVERAQAP